jgi:hypothetical protein
MEEKKLLAKLEKISHTTALPSTKHADAGSCRQIFGTTLVKTNNGSVKNSIVSQIETWSSKTKLLYNFAIWIRKFHIVIDI